MDNKTSHGRPFPKYIPNLPYNYSTPLHGVNLLVDITAKGFGKPHTFGVWVIYACIELLAFQPRDADALSDLDVGACIL